jgi:hypothetical protein
VSDERDKKPYTTSSDYERRPAKGWSQPRGDVIDELAIRRGRALRRRGSSSPSDWKTIATLLIIGIVILWLVSPASEG